MGGAEVKNMRRVALRALRARPSGVVRGAQGTIIAHRIFSHVLYSRSLSFVRSSANLYSLTTRKVHINMPIPHVKKTRVWGRGARVFEGSVGFTKNHEG